MPAGQGLPIPEALRVCYASCESAGFDGIAGLPCLTKAAQQHAALPGACGACIGFLSLLLRPDKSVIRILDRTRGKQLMRSPQPSLAGCFLSGRRQIKPVLFR